jgi:hypothetical protein
MNKHLNNERQECKTGHREETNGRGRVNEEVKRVNMVDVPFI